jgi:hypothetical protein
VWECCDHNEAFLSQFFNEWLTWQGLPAACALELLMGAELTAYQRQWLTQFCDLWDSVVDARLYVVETQVGNTWENIWCEDDKPMTFVSEDEAEAEIEDTLECMQSAYMRGDVSSPMSREEFRIVQTTR